MFGPGPIGEDTIANLAAGTWGIGFESVEYAAIGYGSYHWYGVKGGARWLVTADAADQRPVAEAYELAHRLGGKLDFVRSPLPQLDGGIVFEHGDWLISIWPWVTGRSGTFSEPRSPEELAVVADCLRKLHDCTEFPQINELVEERDIPGRAALMSVARQQPNGRTDGPYASEVADRIGANRSRIHELFARYDDLAVSVWDKADS